MGISNSLWYYYYNHDTTKAQVEDKIMSHLVESYPLSAMGRSIVKHWIQTVGKDPRAIYVHIRNWFIDMVNDIKIPRTASHFQRGCPGMIPGLTARAVWENSTFPWIAALEASFHDIKAEMLALKGKHGFQPYRGPSWTSSSTHQTWMNKENATSSEWNVYYLFLHNMEFHSNQEKCPKTVACIRNVPNEYHHAFFSSLAPNTHITPHHGPTNRKLRIHLPLVVPDGECILRVGKERIQVQEGKCYVFDDSFEHEAWNSDASNARIVLIIDVWHPELSSSEVKFFTFLQNTQLRMEKKLHDTGHNDTFYGTIRNSASMNQICSNGITLLDVAKSAIEHFITIRKDYLKKNMDFLNGRNVDRYFLTTCSSLGYDDAVKISWDRCQRMDEFLEQLKNLKATERSDIGGALQYHFELLNQYRMQYSMDTYGMGMLPWMQTPFVVVLLSDAQGFSSMKGRHHHLHIPPSSARGARLTMEPFRWDQRLFTVQLKLSTFATREGIAQDMLTTNSYALKTLSDATGGSLFCPTTLRGTLQCMEQIVGKARKSGVSINLKLDKDIENKSVKKVFLPSKPSGKEYKWPIPEAYWLDRTTVNLTSRNAHPTLVYRKENIPQGVAVFVRMVLEQMNFPADVYALDPNPTSGPTRGEKWNVYVHNSKGDSTNGDPIGYLQGVVLNGVSVVSLVLLPYNYPVLFKLLFEAARTLESSGHAPKSGAPWIFQPKALPSMWRKGFQSYTSTIPAYYMSALKVVLKQYNLHSLVSDIPDNGRSYPISSYLKRVREMTKADAERQSVKDITIGNERRQFMQVASSNKLEKHNLLPSYSKFVSRPNIWDGSIARLAPTKRAFLEDEKHTVKITEMGNFRAVALQKEVLRDPLALPDPNEDSVAAIHNRKTNFNMGNPWKRAGSSMDSVDNEVADEAAIVEKQSSRRHRSPRNFGEKRKNRTWRRKESLPSKNNFPFIQQTYDLIDRNHLAWRQISKLIRSRTKLSAIQINFIISSLEKFKAYRNPSIHLASIYRRESLLLQLMHN